MLRDKADHVFLLKGGRSRKENEQIRENMKNVPANESMVLVASDNISEKVLTTQGVDTMMLTTPIAWQGNVEQYSGRLHRIMKANGRSSYMTMWMRISVYWIKCIIKD